MRYRRRGKATIALEGINLHLPSGAALGVTGPSGSGKSSLLYLLSGLRRPTTGEVRVDGRPLPEAVRAKEVRRQRHFGFVFQQHLLLNYLTVRENIEVTALKEVSGRDVDQRRAYLVNLLGLVGLEDAFPSEISVGQRQRVAIARALINEPAVIFADEPTASLDRQNARHVMELLETYRREWGTTLIIVSHDGDLLGGMNRVLILSGGRMQE